MDDNRGHSFRLMDKFGKRFENHCSTNLVSWQRCFDSKHLIRQFHVERRVCFISYTYQKVQNSGRQMEDFFFQYQISPIILRFSNTFLQVQPRTFKMKYLFLIGLLVFPFIVSTFSGKYHLPLNHYYQKVLCQCRYQINRSWNLGSTSSCSRRKYLLIVLNFITIKNLPTLVPHVFHQRLPL